MKEWPPGLEDFSKRVTEWPCLEEGSCEGAWKEGLGEKPGGAETADA